MMTCEKCLSILEQSIEDRVSLPAQVAEHFQNCPHPGCRQNFDEYELLSIAIPAWKAIFSEMDLVSRVMQELLENQKPLRRVASPKIGTSASNNTPAFNREITTSRSTEPSQGVVWGLVATLALCLVLMVKAFSGVESATTLVQQGAHSPPVVPASLVGGEFTEDQQVEAELRELGKTYGKWVQGATHRLTDTVTVVLLEEQTPPREGTRNWFSSITEQIEPIESQLDATLKIFLQESPTELDENSFVPGRNQNEYLGLRWSKSASLRPGLMRISV